MRLINQTYNYFNGLNSVSGVVRVCVNQQFVYVCSDGWDDREAQVACRTYNGNYRPPYYGELVLELLVYRKAIVFCVCFQFLVSTASSYMFFGDGPLYHNATCNGGEETFGSCQLPSPNTVASCPSVAAVNCSEC